MDLSLQAIDFLLASSIQDGWPLSDVDWLAGAVVGDTEGDEGDGTFFRIHFSSQGLSGTLTGLDSKRRKTMISLMLRHFGILTAKIAGARVGKPAGHSPGLLGSLISEAALSSTMISPTGRSSACAFAVSTWSEESDHLAL